MRLSAASALILPLAACLMTASGQAFPSGISVPIRRGYPGSETPPSLLELHVAASRAAQGRWSNNGTTAPSFVATNDSSSAPLENLSNLGYFATVSIGTPAQQFTVDLDTGSNRLWVRGSSCQACIIVRSSPPYIPQLSSTAQLTTVIEPLSYGLGSASGYLGYETVEFLGYTSTKQIFNDVAQIDQVFQQQIRNGMDGILGLAFNEEATNPTLASQETVIQGLMRNGAIQNPMFAFWLDAVSPNSVQVSGGEFTLGGYNPERFQGSITWLPVDLIPGVPYRYHWAHRLTAVKIGSRTINTNTFGILDTGTSIMLVDQASFTNIIVPGLGINIYPRSIQGQTLFLVNCRDVKPSLPDIVIYLQDKPFPVSHQQYIKYDPTAGLCFLAIQPAQTIPGWILGDVFLREYYAIFDQGQGRSGLAKIAGNSLPLQPPSLPSPVVQPGGTTSNPIRSQASSILPQAGIALAAVSAIVCLAVISLI